jgi:hypothetical protein
MRLVPLRSGELVAISSETSFFILRYNAQATVDAFEKGDVDEVGLTVCPHCTRYTS